MDSELHPIPKEQPDWQQASPTYIEKALAHSQTLTAAQGWYVIGGNREVPPGKAFGFEVEGKELVFWRDANGILQAAPGACPHLGARLCESSVRNGHLVCPWHGLALGPEGHGRWKTYTVHDDGTLLWVRLQGSEPPPQLPRPHTPTLSEVIALDVRCDAIDVIANRLDPWHGVHFHPHSFAKLRVLERSVQNIRLRVTYRVWGNVGVEVDATFHTPTARCIVMTIVSGPGEGSLVETHATPCGPGRTRVIEATLATSPHPGFRHALKLARLIRPIIARRAKRLWVEDAAYAERRYRLRVN